MANQLLTDKHQPSGFDPVSLSPQLLFEDYIKRTQIMLKNVRLHDYQINHSQVIAANSPFAWYPENFQQQNKKKGILLVHGMLESPFSLWDLGKHFLRQGFLVKAILLPGHGTIPGDLLTVERSQWQETVEYGIDDLEKEVDDVYLLGFSAGAGLALHAAFTDPKRFAGLFLFSPMIGLKTNIALFAHVIDGIGTLYKPARWYRLADDLDYAKYESFPYKTIHQAYRLTQEIKSHIKDKILDIPIFMSFSRDDETIDCLAAEQFFLKQQANNNRLIIYTNHSKPSFDQRIIYRPSHYPEENILHFSHICLHTSPDNEHYGKQGDYHPTLAGHKDKPGKNVHGALTKNNLSGSYLHRLTYNPDFPFLLKAINQFLESI